MKPPARTTPWTGDRCPTSKIAYVTRRAAKDVVRRMKSQGDRQLGVYQCGHCQQWHVGHRPPAVARGIITVDEWQDSVKRRTA